MSTNNTRLEQIRSTVKNAKFSATENPALLIAHDKLAFMLGIYDDLREKYHSKLVLLEALGEILNSTTSDPVAIARKARDLYLESQRYMK
jgi:hypothetical protein